MYWSVFPQSSTGILLKLDICPFAVISCWRCWSSDTLHVLVQWLLKCEIQVVPQGVFEPEEGPGF